MVVMFPESIENSVNIDVKNVRIGDKVSPKGLLESEEVPFGRPISAHGRSARCLFGCFGTTFRIKFCIVSTFAFR